jgi:hypothetical protein
MPLPPSNARSPAGTRRRAAADALARISWYLDQATGRAR